MRRLLVVSLALAIAAPIATATAQPAPAPAPAPAPGPAPAPAPPNAQRREEIKKKIRSLRAYALTTELSLDEKTGSRLWPVLARYDDEIDKLIQARVDLQRRLAAADQLKDPRAQDRLVDEAIANQKAFWSVEERRLAELRKILTPAQTARLLVVLPAFERKIQNQLRRAIVRRTAPGQGPGHDPDDDDLDPDDGGPPPARRRRGMSLDDDGDDGAAPRLRRR
ncbi:MAG TPA: hypothetical protein VNO30_44795 [Kofleriaceae bacterium]|nr:hypothetical protein [Kofleriaceae bacterium]